MEAVGGEKIANSDSTECVLLGELEDDVVSDSGDWANYEQTHGHELLNINIINFKIKRKSIKGEYLSGRLQDMQ